MSWLCSPQFSRSSPRSPRWTSKDFVPHIKASRSGSLYGNGCKRTAFTKLKTAAFRPMPGPSDSNTANVNMGFLTETRIACRKSLINLSIVEFLLPCQLLLTIATQLVLKELRRFEIVSRAVHSECAIYVLPSDRSRQANTWFSSNRPLWRRVQ